MRSVMRSGSPGGVRPCACSRAASHRAVRGSQAQYVALTRFRQAQPSQAFPRTTHVPQCCGCRARWRPARSTWPQAASRPLTPCQIIPMSSRVASVRAVPDPQRRGVSRTASAPIASPAGQPIQSSRRSVPVVGSFRQQVHPFEAQCPQRLPCIVCVASCRAFCAPHRPSADAVGRDPGAPARIVGRLARGVFITWR